jgi:hypothetical protein
VSAVKRLFVGVAAVMLAAATHSDAIACGAASSIDVPLLRSAVADVRAAVLHAGVTVTRFEDIAMREPAQLRTSVKLARDGVNLYVLIDAVQAKDTLKADAETAPAVQGDDFVGVGLTVGDTPHVFFVNPDGRRLELSAASAELHPWNVTASIAADHWTALFAIPYSSIASGGGSEPVRLALFRQKQGGGGRFIYWPPTSCEPLSAEAEAPVSGLDL